MIAKLDPPTTLAGYDPVATAGGCWWDPVAASDAVDFFPLFLCHAKGHTGPFELQAWQRDWIATLFGWKRPDGTRRYRECLGAVPRKNGKTHLAAGMALYCLMCDSEQGAEVYSAAFSRDQASLVFEPAAHMVRSNQMLSEKCRIIDSTKRIIFQRRGGVYRAIPAEAHNTHGFNAHVVLFDELHTQTSRDLYDVLKTSQGARRQPMFVSITTAGHDRHSICWEVWDYARKVRDGIIADPYFLPVIYELDEGEDWEDEDTWRRTNPNFGVSISSEYLRESYNRAKQLPAYENTFRNLHLNQWTEQAVRWLSMEAWDECSEGDVDRLQGAPCWCGLDLSTTKDLSALAMAFRVDGKLELLCKFWVPLETARERSHQDRVPYDQWIKDGWITGTPSRTIDFDRIRADINELHTRYNIRQIAVDKWNAHQIMTQLAGDGFDIVSFGQGYASMSAPSKELERLVIDRSLRHSGNPVLRWMASHVAREEDAAGNIKPSKAKSSERIDGIVASVMAIALATTDTSRDSPYKTRGFLTL